MLKRQPKAPELMQVLVNAITSLQQVTVSETPEYRPCWVNGRKAVFHRWVNSARPQLPRGQEPNENARFFQYRATHALVEYADGTMATVWPTDLQFADSKPFEECWQMAESEDSNQ